MVAVAGEQGVVEIEKGQTHGVTPSVGGWREGRESLCEGSHRALGKPLAYRLLPALYPPRTSRKAARCRYHKLYGTMRAHAISRMSQRDRFRWFSPECRHHSRQRGGAGAVGAAYQSGSLAVPAGGINDRETPEEALYRELNEEVGLEAGDVASWPAPAAGATVCRSAWCGPASRCASAKSRNGSCCG